MNIGRLRHRVTLRKPVETKVGGGVVSVDLEDVETVWAHVRPVSGREFYSQQQVGSAITHEVTIRKPRSNVPDASWRLKFGSRVFQIVSAIDPDERGAQLTMRCTEVVA